jgi:protein-S-isoprenylcysteine O-methyltransferase Ste14
MIFVWPVFFIGFLLCGAILIPRETIRRNSRAPKDWQYYLAHALFYSIPASALLSNADPGWFQLLASFVMFTAGGALHIWAIRSNPYFSPETVEPPEVVCDGAYKWLNHPGYAGMALMATGSWMMVGHQMAIIPLMAYLALLLWRARKETSLIYQ